MTGGIVFWCKNQSSRMLQNLRSFFRLGTRFLPLGTRNIHGIASPGLMIRRVLSTPNGPGTPVERLYDTKLHKARVERSYFFSWFLLFLRACLVAKTSQWCRQPKRVIEIRNFTELHLRKTEKHAISLSKDSHKKHSPWVVFVSA